MVHILDHIELRCVSGRSNKVYHISIIATTGGYQCVAHFGPLHKTLQAHAKSDRDVSYTAARRAFERAMEEKAKEYTVHGSVPPSSPSFLNGQDIEIVEDIEAFVATHTTLRDPDPGSDARRAHTAVQDARRLAAEAAAFAALLEREEYVFVAASTRVVELWRSQGRWGGTDLTTFAPALRKRLRLLVYALAPESSALFTIEDDTIVLVASAPALDPRALGVAAATFGAGRDAKLDLLDAVLEGRADAIHVYCGAKRHDTIVRERIETLRPHLLAQGAPA